MIKVRRGIAEFKSSMLALGEPSSYFGKNPSVANNIANDMCTYERTICLKHFGNCNRVFSIFEYKLIFDGEYLNSKTYL